MVVDMGAQSAQKIFNCNLVFSKNLSEFVIKIKVKNNIHGAVSWFLRIMVEDIGAKMSQNYWFPFLAFSKKLSDFMIEYLLFISKIQSN